MSLKARILIAVMALAIAFGSIAMHEARKPVKEIDQTRLLYPVYIVTDGQIHTVYQ